MEGVRPRVALAVRAHVGGALDFGAMRRYRTLDALRRRLVYGELDREAALEAYRAAYEKLSWFIPVAEDRRSVAKSANEMYQRYLDTLLGRERSGTTDYRGIWEDYWGMKIGSPEYEAWVREYHLRRGLRQPGRKVLM